MGMTERLQIVMTNTEPSNKHVIWLKDDMLKRWTGVGWKNVGGGGGNIEVIDNLTSSNKDKALSANQGRILLDKINSLNGGNVSESIVTGNGLYRSILETGQLFIDHGIVGGVQSSRSKELGFGETFTVNVITADSYGHVQKLESTKFKMPNAPTTIYPLATAERNGLMSKEDKAKLDGLDTSSYKKQLSTLPLLTATTYNALSTLGSDVTFTIYESDYVAEYSGEFSFGDTVYNVTFPSSVVWAVEPVYQPNRKYQFSILNNLGIMCEFPLNN